MSTWPTTSWKVDDFSQISQWEGATFLRHKTHNHMDDFDLRRNMNQWTSEVCDRSVASLLQKKEMAGVRKKWRWRVCSCNPDRIESLRLEKATEVI